MGIAARYIRDGCVTAKSDVYSYGVVLMELITGKPALSRTVSTENNQCTEHRSVVTFMLSALEDDHNPMAHLVQCVDPNLTHYHKDSLLQVALLSKDCVDDDWNRRPDMSKVALRLSHILECSMEWEVVLPNRGRKMHSGIKTQHLWREKRKVSGKILRE
ncbi:lysM domain-containing protein [Cinnamomum micranthum f. kanehirae]|uniref:LysM domain-containing protein n=1 Tax=Cinnamomum micranthum f. kanehirae TaxID=337451 RepID=A0A443N4B5_9MAGN|nr:lysM domain-containing protein [Cinnamomum micranthum f. kanehirae]